MLVGDILLSAREAVPDLPGVIPNPSATDVVASAMTSGSPFPAGTYYFQFTYTNSWGETGVSAEQAVTLDGTQGVLINATASPYLNVITGVNVYLGYAPGAEIQKYSFPFVVGGSMTVMTAATPYAVATPPEGNSAFLPDTGGSVASASQIYRWFQDALNMIATANGGVPDTCGFGTVLGQALYRLQGDWKDIDAAWYDGYPVFLGSGKQVYRHNSLTSIVGMMSYSQIADQLVVECFPQPIRTAGTTNTNAALSATGSSVSLTGWGGFVLPYGVLQFQSATDPTQIEYASFTANGNNAVSMIRGLGGTVGRAWPSGTIVNEMNAMFAGWRAPSLYNVGDASKTITLPSDWVPLLHMYILGRYRQIEQQQDQADRLTQGFMAGMGKATKRKAPVGERQIQPLDTTMVDVYPGLSRTFGGLIIP